MLSGTLNKEESKDVDYSLVKSNFRAKRPSMPVSSTKISQVQTPKKTDPKPDNGWVQQFMNQQMAINKSKARVKKGSSQLSIEQLAAKNTKNTTPVPKIDSNKQYKAANLEEFMEKEINEHKPTVKASNI